MPALMGKVADEELLTLQIICAFNTIKLLWSGPPARIEPPHCRKFLPTQRNKITHKHHMNACAITPQVKGINSVLLGFPDKQVYKFPGLAESRRVKTSMLYIQFFILFNAIGIGR